MSGRQRLRRLEALEREQGLRESAERLAEEFGLAPEDALHELRELAARVDRWGIDAELRRLADDLGISEAEARSQYQAELARTEQRASQ